MSDPAPEPIDRPRILLRDHAPGGARWLCFASPRQILRADSAAEVPALLAALQSALDAGAWLAGYFAYEATPAFDPAFAAHPPRPGEPVAWWGVFEAPATVAAPEPAEKLLPVHLDWQPALAEPAHALAVDAVRAAIERGDTYQVNLTFALESACHGLANQDPETVFARLLGDPPPPYAALVDTGARWLLSASPELFFRLDGRSVHTRPMKGTSPRGRWREEDDAFRRQLGSEKNRAENLMIADMMRNDLGRVARPGSVQVRSLFEVESYPTVHQLVTAVDAELDAGVGAFDLLRALFPSASITGAPKARTSQLICGLEAAPRGVYTGSIGYFAPDGRAQMNVAIRTLEIDRVEQRARFGTGGGVVWDSVASEEYAEALTKTRLLARLAGTQPDPPFRLLETLSWRPGSGYFLLDRHLERLAASAEFFGYRCDRERILGELGRAEQGWRAFDATPSAARRRVRLLVDAAGAVEVEHQAQPCAGRRLLRVVLDDRPVDEQDPFLCHKTTRRDVYEQAAARHPGADDVILWNRRGELTEATRANLVLRVGPRWLTPARSCGLLAGTYRQALLERGRLVEATLSVADLATVDEFFLINSVQGWMRATLAPGPAGADFR